MDQAQARLQEIDRELEALGELPADVLGLIARYAGTAAVDASRADELLAALGVEPLPVPPRLQPTEVDVAAPAAWDLSSAELDEPAPEAASHEAASALAASGALAEALAEATETRASVFPPAAPRDEPPSDDASSDASSDDASTGDWSLSADALAEERFVSEAPRGRAAFPWESEPPPAMAPENAELAAAPRRRDTAEIELPQDVAERLAAAPSLELPVVSPAAFANDASDAPAQSHEEGLAVDSALSQVLGSDASEPLSNESASEAREDADGDDEFEIMVDDDVLEIDDGDMEIVDE